ncbi:HlyC/CorC family transporter [bacterium]|nr:HlyC/CorC family transporter [bacterium]
MDDIPLSLLFGTLVVLIALSAFFSSSETALMTINRYRLRHMANSGHRAARLASTLLERPDRLIGVILLGNNFVNIMASSIATIIGLRLFGEAGLALAMGVLTLVILIFAEVTPKTMAALHPERIAFPASYVYWVLLRVLYPFVWMVNLLSNGVLRLLGVTPEDAAEHSLSSEELRTVVAETGAMIPQRHQRMLLSILDLEKATVEDIMVPRNEIVGIDLEDREDTILHALRNSQHTRLPVFEGAIDELHGIVHLRRLIDLTAEHAPLDKDKLRELAREPYFIPEGTPLNQQLLNFQNQKRRIGFVVDEYGDIQGLVTLEDILEEIVGEFTTDPATRMRNVFLDADGSYLVDGTANVRTLNRTMGWKLPTNGPRTLNGLILEALEYIPTPGTELQLNQYALEVTKTQANAVKTVRVRPPRKIAKAS